MHKLKHHIPISLASIILTQMNEVATSSFTSKAFAFPLIISQVIRHFEVDFTGKYAIPHSTTYTLTTKTFQNCGYIYDTATNEWPKKADAWARQGIPTTAQESVDPSTVRSARRLQTPLSNADFQVEIRTAMGQLQIEMGRLSHADQARQAQLEQIQQSQHQILQLQLALGQQIANIADVQNELRSNQEQLFESMQKQQSYLEGMWR